MKHWCPVFLPGDEPLTKLISNMQWILYKARGQRWAGPLSKRHTRCVRTTPRALFIPEKQHIHGLEVFASGLSHVWTQQLLGAFAIGKHLVLLFLALKEYLPHPFVLLCNAFLNKDTMCKADMTVCASGHSDIRTHVSSMNPTSIRIPFYVMYYSFTSTKSWFYLVSTTFLYSESPLSHG